MRSVSRVRCGPASWATTARSSPSTPARRASSPSASASPRTVPSSTDLRVGGLSPLSSVDWPGELVATVFTRGCPWLCPYCHNSHLRGGGTAAVAEGDGFTWDDVLLLLRGRVGLLDGVVFTGGEPLAQSALAGAMSEVRELGFRVGLHTGGPLPERMREVLPLVDWVGFDFKAPFADYERVTGVAGSGESARESFEALIASGVPFEVRTTVHSVLLDDAALVRMAEELTACGAASWVLQPFRPQGCDDEALLAAPRERFVLPEALASGPLAVEIRE
ncbi:MAG: anaerobic ribonucleoside-triphosphate reductase activating protein [Coriobacteriia bacterium]|nr:anaerobic ribonucleoside-triphosphate reductase activating protein [Coriobacteriia bacterium]